MADRQLFAKLGVCVLLGLNVGGYYVFWPHHESASKSDAKAPTEEKGEARLLPAKTAKPNDLPPIPLVDVNTLNIPGPPKKSEPGETPEETLAKLLDHIKKETDAGTMPPPSPFDQKKDAFADKQLIPANGGGLPEPRPLPPLNAVPLRPDPKVGITSPLTPKVPKSDCTTQWDLQTKIEGTQTLLIAKLQGSVGVAGYQPVPLAELQIRCDRVENKPGGKEVLALGNVSCIGARLRGQCRRLTLPLAEGRIILEDQVVVGHSEADGVLRGERIVWDLIVTAPAKSSKFSPAVLGSPK